MKMKIILFSIFSDYFSRQQITNSYSIILFLFLFSLFLSGIIYYNFIRNFNFSRAINYIINYIMEIQKHRYINNFQTFLFKFSCSILSILLILITQVYKLPEEQFKKYRSGSGIEFAQSYICHLCINKKLKISCKFYS